MVRLSPVANRTGSSLRKLAFDGSPIARSPYFGAGLNGSLTVGTGTITQIVGVAAPVVTPASVAVQNNALDQRP
jgi:hypothetical protein